MAKVTAATEGTRTLVAGLEESGPLPAAYRSAFLAVDRADFIPDRIWYGGDEKDEDTPLDRAMDPQQWSTVVYDATMPIVTQWDDGAVMWPEQGVRPTSSASAPTVVADMLRVLGPEPGDRVLEIGTGTGYNAALLSEIVGRSGDVITTEVDLTVAGQARERLIATGREARFGAGMANVLTLGRDGGAVAPVDDRPWDRVIATAGVPLGRMPYGWVHHTRPGGVIVAPMFADFTSDPLVRLVVGNDGVARGHADSRLTVGFMALRSQRPNRAALNRVPWDAETADLTHTTVDIWDPLHHPDWCWAVAVAVPSCRFDTYPAGTRSASRLVLLEDPVSRSWASIHGQEGHGELAVRQAGPRRLADEVFAAIRWFARRGAPPLHSWLWEVGPDRQTVTLPD
ncbi:MAG: protein-L-isoaspartate(D-aspartate) O-methyltransferase [Pseudonocardiaceae bacterium]|nr:protein-L-isoaspartate(D-aspartate) O-methyltransferase [Pseudonocardiaceae bacterium]